MPIQPGQQPSRAQYNRAEEQTRRVANMRGGPGMRFRNTPAGVQVAATGEGCWARLTAAPAGAGQGYAWEEIVDDGMGGQAVLPGGGSGTTTSYQAFPWNGVPVPLTGADGHPTVVYLWPAPNSETMVFFLGTSANVRMVRITGYPTVDTINLAWWYPGLFQIDPLNPLYTAMTGNPPYQDDATGQITVTDGRSNSVYANCWVKNAFSYMLGSSVDQTIGGDGTSFRVCRDAGCVFDANNSNVTGANKLPVWDTSEYAGLITSSCSGAAIIGQRLEATN